MNEVIKDRADIFGESFKDLNLSGKKISYAEFDDCSFKNCDFSNTYFHACIFRDCFFENCNLGIMKLIDSKIGGCKFISSKLNGIDWSMCDWQALLCSEGLSFESCVLSDSNFSSLKLQNLKLQECLIKDCDFRNTTMINANCKQSDFEGSLFDNTNLTGADFTDAKNISLKVSKNHFKDTKISHFQALAMLELDGIIIK